MKRWKTEGQPRRKWLYLLALVAVLSISAWLLGQGQTVLVGYSVLTADPNNRIPVATALFSVTNGQNVLVSQAGVQAMDPIRNGRIFVDEAGTLTALVLVNANTTPAAVNLVLRDNNGVVIDSKTNQPWAAGQDQPLFVNQLFPNRPNGMQGSLTFTSNQPLAALTLRSTDNANREPIYATLPVTDLAAAPTSTPLVFPHLAVGGGYATQLALVNPTSQALRGTVRLFDQSGQPLSVTVLGNTVSNFTYQIPADGTYRPEMNRTGGAVVGYAVVTPDPGNTAPVGTVIFRYTQNGALVTEAGVPAITPTTKARLFVDNIKVNGNRTVDTGVAIANSSTQTAEVTLSLLSTSGAVQQTTTRTMAAGSQTALFASQLFTIYDGFSGLMEVSSPQAISPLTLKYTENSLGSPIYTTLPIADLTRPPLPTRVVFPHIAIGGSYSTRFITMNTDPTAVGSGTINFYATNGAPLSVPLGGNTVNQFSYSMASGGGRQYYPGNSAQVSRIALIDPVSNEETTELVINENSTAVPRVRIWDTSQTIRDDFDVSLTSISGLDVATVNNVSGSVEGKKTGFSTFSISAGGAVTTVTANVVGVNTGINGFSNGLVQNGAQELYLASTEDHTIRTTPNLKQTASVYAGTVSTPGLANGPRSTSRFKGPTSLAYSSENDRGYLYVSDSANQVIRRILVSNPNGPVETFAGSGVTGSLDGVGTQASFNNPQGIVIARGYLWVVDSGNHTFRRINLVTGKVELMAGSPGNAGNADGTGTGARFNAPQGLAVEPQTESQRIQGNGRGTPPAKFVIADSGNGTIRRVTVNENSGAPVVQVETMGAIASGIAAFPEDLKEKNRSTAVVVMQAFQFRSPSGVAIDSTGTVFVSEPGSGQVRAILATGSVVAAAQTATFERPRGLIVTPGGRLLVADSKRPLRELQYGAPEINTITPVRVSNRGGEQVTIRGRNFAPDSVVVIGGVLLQNVVPTNTETITFTTPALPSGMTTLSVRTRGGLAQKPLLVDAVPISELGAGQITTAAGGSTFAGDGALASLGQLSFPNAVTVDVNGNAFIADTEHHRIRRVDATSGVITTVAGTGRPGSSPDGNLAIASALSSPSGVALDAAGNIFIADTDNNRICKVIASTGTMVTVAGNLRPSFFGDGGPATSASLGYPWGVAVGPQGDIYIADTANQRIRKVTATTGVISTIAGNGTAAFSGDGGAATAASLYYPWGLAVDSSGNVYIADTYNHRIRKVTAAGTISTVVGNGTGTFAGDGGTATAASLRYPFSLTVDSGGNLYIADTYNYRIRKVTNTGVISTLAGAAQSAFAGDGGLATAASLALPGGVAVDASGVVFIADTYNQRVRRISPTTRIITTLAGDGRTHFAGDGGAANSAIISSPSGIVIDNLGNIFFADMGNNRIRRIAAGSSIITTVAGNGLRDSAGDGGPATSAALSKPRGVALLQSGTTRTLYIADSGNQKIRKVVSNSAGIFDSTSVISLVAGNGNRGYTGDGAAATAAALSDPVSVAVDTQGNVFIADRQNHRIRKVTAAGIISTYAGIAAGAPQSGFADGAATTAAKFDEPVGVALDSSGNLYVADFWNYRIRKVTPAGVVSTVAGNGAFGYSGDGGPATSASIGAPLGVSVDPAGNIYIADTYNDRVRKVSTTGTITTVVGNGAFEFSGDNGLANAAGLASPVSIGIDGRSGNMYISDATNDRIRAVRSTAAVVPPRTCTAINSGQQVAGSLGAASPLSRNQPSFRADCYTTTRNAGDLITISMNATAFDTYLYLSNSVGQVVAADNDGGGGTNSRIPAGTGSFIVPATGTYTIEASTSTANAAGSYTLTMTVVTVPTNRPCTSLAFGVSTNGALTNTDLPARNRIGTSSDCFTFSGNTGDRVTIGLTSTQFDAYLYLMNPVGQVLAQDDDSGGDTNSKIPATGYFTLPAAGTYTIEVTSYWAGEFGNYSVVVNRFGTTTTATCQSISFGQTIGGALTSTDPRSLQRTGAYADCYAFSANAGDLISISLSSTTIDTYLYLINSAGQVMASNDDSGTGANSRIPSTGSYTIPASGAYTIQATSFDDDEVGSYSLSLVRATAAAVCSPIAYGQTVSGALSGTDSRSRVQTSSYADCYQFTGAAGDAISISMTSSAFDTYLVLMNPSGQVLTQNDDAGGGTNSRIPMTGSYTLPASGTFTIEATSYSDATGNYSLSLVRATAITCATISYGQTISGTLATTDPRSTAWPSGYADCYQFNGTAGDSIVVNESAAFDTYLYFMDSTKRVLSEDDDSGGGTNSRVTYTLPSTGTYVIEATSYGADITGSYTLSLTRTNASTTCTTATYGVPVGGQLSTTDARSATRTGAYADCYQFVGSAGDAITITLNSTIIDPWLILMSPSRAILAQDDDGNGNSNSRITYTLTASGTYFIEATSYDPDETGGYTLLVTRGAPPLCASITYGQTINGTLSTTDSRSIIRPNAYADCYQFSGNAGDAIVLALNSSLDTYMTLMNSSRQILVEDDDSGGNGNSRIPYSGSYTLPATGTYVVEATSFDPNLTGAYTLSLTRTSGSSTSTSCTPVSVIQTISGVLSTTDPQLYGSYYDCYTFTVGANSRIAVALSSNSFDAYLELVSPSGSLLYSDDDGGGGTNARIPASSGFLSLQSAGTYTIRATSFSSNQTGSYTLQLSQ